LREAVLRVHPVPNESASDEATADAPTSDETVAASPPEEKKWVVKKPDAISKPSADSKYYQVRPGDTLAQIAKRHGVSAARLKEWNGKKVYPVLQANARIVVRQNQVVKYKVKPGDNLTKIAQKHSTTPAEIQKMNGLKSNVILPGAVLVVQHSK
jgi:LysM repeat protein